MKIENRKIVKATENELFDFYLKIGMDDIMSFTDYIEKLEKSGCEVEKNQ